MSTNTAMQQQVYPPSVPTDSGRGMMINSSAAVSAIPAWHPRPPRWPTKGVCTNCRSRRTRCDAVRSGDSRNPCTNCTTFSIRCTRSTRQSARMKESEYEARDSDVNQVGLIRENGKSLPSLHPMQLLENHLLQEADDTNLYVQFLKPEVRHAPIVEPGRIAYLGESSNFPLLVDDDPSSTDVVHYQLPENFRDSRAKLAKMENAEIGILRQRGALSLPPWKMCDDLVESYFKWVAPVLPVINRSRFMRQYRDPNNPPSLLLLQAIFLAGSAVSGTGTEIAGTAFYKRAKALYDAGYEDDRIVTVQALVLIGWYWEKSRDHAEDAYYWNGLATTVALGSGIRRSTERSPLSNADKRLWRRIWWTLFVRDRSVALVKQLIQIHTDDSDVEMVCEEDFIDDEYPPNPIQVQFFLQYVKLCVLIGTTLPLKGLMPLKVHSRSAVGSKRIEKALLAWLKSCTRELKWEDSSYNFWSASLYCGYKATIALLHGEDLPALPLCNDHWIGQHFEGPRHLLQREYLVDQLETD